MGLVPQSPLRETLDVVEGCRHTSIYAGAKVNTNPQPCRAPSLSVARIIRAAQVPPSQTFISVAGLWRRRFTRPLLLKNKNSPVSQHTTSNSTAYCQTQQSIPPYIVRCIDATTSICTTDDIASYSFLPPTPATITRVLIDTIEGPTTQPTPALRAGGSAQRRSAGWGLGRLPYHARRLVERGYWDCVP